MARNHYKGARRKGSRVFIDSQGNIIRDSRHGKGKAIYKSAPSTIEATASTVVCNLSPVMVSKNDDPTAPEATNMWVSSSGISLDARGTFELDLVADPNDGNAPIVIKRKQEEDGSYVEKQRMEATSSGISVGKEQLDPTFSIIGKEEEQAIGVTSSGIDVGEVVDDANFSIKKRGDSVEVTASG